MKRLYVQFVLLLLAIVGSYAQDYSFTKDDINNLIINEKTLNNIESGISATELADEIFNHGVNNELITNIKGWYSVARSAYDITSKLKSIKDQADAGLIPDYFSALESYDGDLFCYYFSEYINKFSLGAGDLICIGVKFYADQDKKFLNHQIKSYIDFKNQGVFDPYLDEDRGDKYLLSSGGGSNTELPLHIDIYNPDYVKSIIEKYYNNTLHYDVIKKDNEVKYQKFCEQLKELNDRIAGYKSGALIDVYYNSEFGIIIANNGDDDLTNITLKKQNLIGTTDMTLPFPLPARQIRQEPIISDPNALFPLKTSDIDLISFNVLGIPIELNLQNCIRPFVMNMNATPSNLGITNGYAPDLTNIHYSVYCNKNDRINLNINFGDGEVTDLNNMIPNNDIGVTRDIKHLFKKDGNYSITVTATNQANNFTNSVSKLLILNKALTAPRNFSTISEVTPYMSVNLNGDVVNTIFDKNQLQYKWDFDYNFTDFNSENTDKNPQHIFSVSPAELNYKSIVTKYIGFIVENTYNGILYLDTTSQPIDIRNPIYPAFQLSPSIDKNGTVFVDMLPFEINFDASGSRCQKIDALSFTWDFGDGTSGTGKIITHSFTSKNTYTVKLTINDGVYSNSITKKVIIDYDPVTFTPKKIVKLEYFFDSDPGFGKGTNIDVPYSTKVSKSFTIGLENLSVGLHRLYIRTKDDSTRWSIPQSQIVIVQAFNPSATQVTDAEYFFDQDLGYGNGIKMSVQSGNNVTIATLCNLQNITSGMHRVYFRAKDNVGNWSIPQSQIVIVQQTPLASKQVIDAEYFFDNDPGVGYGIKLPVQSGDSISISTIENIQNVSVGLHRMYFRVKDNSGNWGIPQSQIVIVQNSSNANSLSKINFAEYFFDTDPGLGLATKFTITSSNDVLINETLNIENLVPGIHTLSVRVRDESGKWSIPVVAQFEVEKGIYTNLNSDKLNPENKYKIYGGQGKFTVLTPNNNTALKYQLKIYNLNGAMILEKSLTGTQRISMNKGIYVIQTIHEKSTAVEKVLVY